MQIIYLKKPLARPQKPFVLFCTPLIILLLLSGCSKTKPLELMPTPILYDQTGIDPFAHLSAERKNTKVEVFYSTTRTLQEEKGEYLYGNRYANDIHLGKASVRLGDPDTKWETLHQSSLSSNGFAPLRISLEQVEGIGSLKEGVDYRNKETLGLELEHFVHSINSELSQSLDKEIMLYVHGTKVDFTNSVVLTAEIDHFAGRDFVGVAFSWPSHQNILSYILGVDVARAREASAPLGRLLSFLAEYTDAERINILSYSAGGRVTSKALSDLVGDSVDMEQIALKDKYRLGSVVFAAADVSVDTFLERLPRISMLAEQVVITVSDDDNALHAAKTFMGGRVRAGTSEAEVFEEEYLLEHHLNNVEIVDVSAGKVVRGFDITGHHYWYRHPWMSSDIIFLMRTNLPPLKRGLSPTELEGVWYLSPDYPLKIKEAVNSELGSQWGATGD